MINVPVFVCSIVSLVLTVCPFLWNFRQRNIAAIIFIVYVVIGNICMILNSSLYGGHDISTYWDGKIFGDIVAHLLYICAKGVPCCLLAVARTLAAILSKKVTLSSSTSQRRHELVVQLLICVGVPFLFLSLYYIYQPYRYIILQYGGCVPAYDNSWVSLVLYTIWEPIIVVMTSVYSLLTIYRYFQRRREFRQILRSSQSGLTVSRFARLLFFCIAMIVVELPLALYNLASNVQAGIGSYHWHTTHTAEKWKTIPVVPMTYIRPDMFSYMVCSVMLLIYFGFGADARLIYQEWMVALGFRKLFPSSRWLAPSTAATGTSGSNYNSTLSSKTGTDTLVSTSRPTRFDTWQGSRDAELDDVWNEKLGSPTNAVMVIGGLSSGSRSDSVSTDGIDGDGVRQELVRVRYEVRVDSD